MMVELHDPVVALMRQVGRDIVMPRYQNLAAEEISEKAANDFVTIADKESEIRLAEGLTSFKSNQATNCAISKNSSSPCPQPSRAR